MIRKRWYDMDIVLVCSGGVSATIFIKKLKMYAEEEGMDYQIHACGMTELNHKVDVLLLSPQAAYAKRQFLKYVEEEHHILVIDSFTYSSLDARETLRQIKEIL